ncbi:MAG: hypothetical protein ACXWKT_02480 [Caulobacteraceae bacterium]
MSKMAWRWAAVALAASALGACASQLRMSPDFAVAVRQNIAAQIADPDARYVGTPQPGTTSERVAAAQQRLASGKVIQPAATSTSSVLAGGGGGGQ